jgi:dTMP kinase
VRTGLLVVFEGPEGGGKSTQVARLANLLRDRGVQHMVVREPGGTDVGEQIRRLLLDTSTDLTAVTECLLFLASRAELVRRVLDPALERGEVVLLDRFFLSTYAYQVAGRGLDAAAVAQANALATGGLVPDITLLLSLDPTAGMARARARGAHDRMELTGNEFHARVAAAFREYASPDWQRLHPECGDIVSVDASASADEVFYAIQRELQTKWPQRFPLPDERERE